MPDDIVGLAHELAALTRERDDSIRQNGELQREVARLRKVEQDSSHLQAEVGNLTSALDAASSNARQWQDVASNRERQAQVLRGQLAEAVTKVEQFKEQLVEVKVALRDAEAVGAEAGRVADAQRKRAEEAVAAGEQLRHRVALADSHAHALRAFLEE